MLLSNSARRTKRYLITSQDPQRLAEAIRIVKADPTMELLDEIGPANQPHTLVVGMGDEQAAALKQRFAGQLIVEQDRPVTLFNQPRGVAKGGKAGRVENGRAEEGPARQPSVKPVEQQTEEDRIEMPDKPEQVNTNQPQASSGTAMSAQSASGRGGATATGTGPGGAPPG